MRSASACGPLEIPWVQGRHDHPPDRSADERPRVRSTRIRLARGDHKLLRQGDLAGRLRQAVPLGDEAVYSKGPSGAGVGSLASPAGLLEHGTH